MDNILVIGDLHIDDKWVEDTDEVLGFITDYVVKNNPGYIVLLGDIYHRRDVQKGSKEEKRFHKFLGDISQNSEVYVLVGNHDIADENRTLISELAEASITNPNISLLHSFMEFKFSRFPFRLFFVPWASHHRTETNEWFKNFLPRFEQCDEEFIIFGHLPFAEAFSDKPSKVFKHLPSIGLIDKLKNYRLGIFGDIHQPIEMSKKSIYAGAIRNVTFNETGQKRIILLKEDGYESIPLPNRNTYVLEIEYDDLIKLPDNEIDKYKNGIVKLKINCTKDQHVDPRTFNKKWGEVYKLEFISNYEGRIDFKNLDIADDVLMFNTYCDQYKGVISDDILGKIKTVGGRIIEGG